MVKMGVGDSTLEEIKTDSGKRCPRISFHLKFALFFFFLQIKTDTEFDVTNTIPPPSRLVVPNHLLLIPGPEHWHH